MLLKIAQCPMCTLCFMFLSVTVHTHTWKYCISTAHMHTKFSMIFLRVDELNQLICIYLLKWTYSVHQCYGVHWLNVTLESNPVNLKKFAFLHKAQTLKCFCSAECPCDKCIIVESWKDHLKHFSWLSLPHESESKHREASSTPRCKSVENISGWSSREYKLGILRALLFEVATICFRGHSC